MGVPGLMLQTRLRRGSQKSAACFFMSAMTSSSLAFIGRPDSRSSIGYEMYVSRSRVSSLGSAR